MSFQTNARDPSDRVREYGAPEYGFERLPRRGVGDILACGFGITVAVWIAAYVCRMPIMQASGPATVFAMLGMVLAGGFLAARYSARGVICAVMAGAVSGVLDILIVGSLIHDYVKSHQSALVPSVALWFGGSILLNTVVAGVGGMAGIFVPSARRSEIQWTQVLGMILLAATLPLITAGGLVTAFRAGLAVPDWPQSYTHNMFLFPLSMMQKNEGNFYEHAHRLMGSLVGLTVLTLAIYTSFAEKRAWVKWMVWGIGVCVLIQAVLGGFRVTEKSIALAISHGVFAQVVFASMGALAAIMGKGFLLSKANVRPTATTDRGITALLVGAVVGQLILGAVLRHTNELLLLHISTATVVVLLAMACGIRAWGMHGALRPLLRSGLWVIGIVWLQIVLGLVALVFRTPESPTPTVAAAMITTAHQANGALLLMLSAVLLTWTWRLIAPAEAADAPVAVSV